VSAVTVFVFAKFPEPGAVKTRMMPPLTATEAAELHRASLLAVLETLRAVGGINVTLAVTPDDRVDALAALVAGQDVACRSQGDGDLGRRLARATNGAFSGGAEGVLLLGADSPTLPGAILSEAVARLVQREAVLGPCVDGGYYLLGLPRPMPTLFDRITWGGSDVADQTRRRAVAANMPLRELPLWYDLDRYADLARGARDLAETTSPQGPHVLALRTLIGEFLGR